MVNYWIKNILLGVLLLGFLCITGCASLYPIVSGEPRTIESKFTPE
ncbi:MAG: hypothetical protein NTU90_04530 [Proteobacteria bacterium]|nr:hypothetical protein [Pseudomonadota bacterium]